LPIDLQVVSVHVLSHRSYWKKKKSL